MAQFFNPNLSLVVSSFSFKLEWNGYNSNRQDIHIFGHFCNNWRCTSSGTTAHSGSDENHFGIGGEHTADFFHAFHGRLFTNFRVSTGSQTFGERNPQLDLNRHRAIFQGLGICVAYYKVNSLYALAEHMVNGVTSPAPYTNNLYHIGLVFWKVERNVVKFCFAAHIFFICGPFFFYLSLFGIVQKFLELLCPFIKKPL